MDYGYTWKISDFAFLHDSAEALALLEKHKIPNWEINHMVYDLAKALAESENARKI